MNSSAIQTQLAAAIAEAAPSVVPAVIKTLVTKEVDRRAALLLSAIDLATSLKRDFTKINRGDITPALNAAGQPVGEALFTKGRLAEIKKLNEKIAKVETAIEAATSDTPNYDKLAGLKGEMDKADKAAAVTEEPAA